MTRQDRTGSGQEDNPYVFLSLANYWALIATSSSPNFQLLSTCHAESPTWHLPLPEHGMDSSELPIHTGAGQLGLAEHVALNWYWSGCDMSVCELRTVAYQHGLESVHSDCPVAACGPISIPNVACTCRQTPVPANVNFNRPANCCATV